MRVDLIFLCFCYFYSSIHCESEDEITFGGASEEEIEAPIIKFNNNDSIVKSEMQYLYVTCNATNYAPNTYTIRWKKASGEVVSPNKILYYKSLLKFREGIYLCEIVKEKKTFNKTLNLMITIPSISIKILPEESLRIGGNIRRKCSDLGLEGSTIVDILTYKWVNERNLTVSTTDILDIPIKDTSERGIYECHLISKETSKVYMAKTTVDIQEQKRSATNYRIQITTNPAEMKLLEQLSMRCDVTPPDGFAYRWFKNDVPLGTDQTIIFQSFKKDDVGTYKCKATVRLSSGDLTLEAESTQQFSIFKHSKIELAEKPGPNIFVHAGEKKELHCEIEADSGKRGVDVEWYVKGQRFQSGDIQNIGRLDKELVSMLVISNITPENEGNYECRVGASRKEANLIVLMEPGIIETSPPVLRVKEGNSVEFHCRVDNIVNVKNKNLTWRFESKDGFSSYEIPNSRWGQSNSPIAEQTSFIDLTSAQLHDNGYLICSEPGGKKAKSELIVIPNDANVVTITPKEIRVRPGQRFDIECFTKNREGRASGQPRFVFGNDQSIGRDARFAITNVGQSHIRLTAPNGLTLGDDNMKVFCASGEQRVTSNIYIKDLCPPGHRYCQNGQCLENAKFCDGKNDCDDGSDENPIFCKTCDPISKKCETHRGAIPLKNHYLIHWTCDGEEDCGNGYDEDNCGDGFFENCGGKYFTCSDGKKIPRGYLCDQNTDCPDGDDENACTYPQIVKTSTSDIKAAKSQQITMSCEASGKPLPTIIWRFNWGCIPQTDRFIIRSYSRNCSTVSSTLTINNFRAGDDGIYNCEALSSRQRAFSNDFLVVLQNQIV